MSCSISPSSVASAMAATVTLPRATAPRTARLNMQVADRTAWCQYTFRYIWYFANSSDSSALTPFSCTPTSRRPSPISTRVSVASSRSTSTVP